MKRNLITLSILAALAGCQSLGYQGMSAEQIKATAGTISCVQLKSIYGTSSMISINEQDVRKGATAMGELSMTCGDASLANKTNVGVPVPAGATTTTTTTVVPAR